MALRFRSKAGADVLMLDADAERVLAALGRAMADDGIFLPEQVAPALLHFEQTAVDPAAADDEDAESVDLRRRAWPLLELLRAGARLGVPVVWGRP